VSGAAPLPAPGPAAIAPYPEGSRILHIGPPKTGTTALQGACWQARDALKAQGVIYAGGQLHAIGAARAVTGRPLITSERREVPPIRLWQALVAEMERAGTARTLYSSEALAEATDEAVRRIVDDVGPSIQVLVTLRPIDAVIASNWQQGIQQGGVQSLDDWLRRVLDGSGEAATGLLRVLRHGELVDRWAAVAGRERVTVLVLDPADPGFLFRSAEGLLALRAGTLQPADGRANRSLTFPEAEVVRRMNIQAREAGIGNAARANLIYFGAAANAKRRPPAPDAPQVRLPPWALDRAIELGQDAQRRLVASGVRIIGDPASLAPAPRPDRAGSPLDERDLMVDPETVAAMAMGVAWGFGLRLGPDQPGGSRKLAMVFVPTRELVRQIIKRGLAFVGRRAKLAGLSDH
jgi:hypothetical protein